MKKSFLALALLMASSSASAEDAVWLNMGGVSWHPDTSGMNGRNPGIGLEWELDHRRFVAVGMYLNSLSKPSRYAVYGWRPYDTGMLSGGVIAGVIDGYDWRDGKAIPMATPYMVIEGQNVALNVVVIPKVEKHVSTTVAVQLKFRVK